MNKKYFLYAIIPALALSFAGVAVYASQTQGANPMASLVTKIAEKFNLSQSDVQAVFDEYQTQMQTERQQKMDQQIADELAKAVLKGKLTQAQANLITAKRAELKSQMQQNTGTPKTQEERQAQKTLLEQWAKDNGIDVQYFRFLQPGFKGGFDGPGLHRGQPPENQSQDQ